jgi:hypothetical protein
MKKPISLFLLSLSFCYVLAQDRLLTTAERSNYQSTSTYKEVISFIDALAKNSPFARLESFATSVEGRKIPLLIIANPIPGGPEDLVNDDRIVVYIQGNIHAGEIEG